MKTSITIQFDANGSFRLIHADGTKGEWAYYRHIAYLEYEGKTYIAASEYGLLPIANKVFMLTDEGIQTIRDSFRYPYGRSTR